MWKCVVIVFNQKIQIPQLWETRAGRSLHEPAHSVASLHSIVPSQNAKKLTFFTSVISIFNTQQKSENNNKSAIQWIILIVAKEALTSILIFEIKPLIMLFRNY
jgi:hypothetical protein